MEILKFCIGFLPFFCQNNSDFPDYFFDNLPNKNIVEILRKKELNELCLGLNFLFSLNDSSDSYANLSDTINSISEISTKYVENQMVLPKKETDLKTFLLHLILKFSDPMFKLDNQ